MQVFKKQKQRSIQRSAPSASPISRNMLRCFCFLKTSIGRIVPPSICCDILCHRLETQRVLLLATVRSPEHIQMPAHALKNCIAGAKRGNRVTRS